MIDLHSHILPGLDDGARNLQESLEMARIAEKEGIEKIVATPHLFRGEFIHKDFGIIEKKRLELSNALRENNIHIDILTGAEVHISHNLISQIKQNRELLTLNKSSYMFVEFPSDHVFSGAKELFFELKSEGINPIIAHPERNSVFAQKPSLLYELTQMGGLAQANSQSFTGIYGRRTEETVFYFLELNLIHFIGSDSHNTGTLAPRVKKAVKRIETAKEEKVVKGLIWDNPKAVIENREIPFLPEPMNEEEANKKIWPNIPFLSKK
jgi:protein-tyrosine phosphatase